MKITPSVSKAASSITVQYNLQALIEEAILLFEKENPGVQPEADVGFDETFTFTISVHPATDERPLM